MSKKEGKLEKMIVFSFSPRFWISASSSRVRVVFAEGWKFFFKRLRYSLLARLLRSPALRSCARLFNDSLAFGRDLDLEVFFLGLDAFAGFRESDSKSVSVSLTIKPPRSLPSS